jgi:acetyl-CoA carboxylase biotin carboxyl carrier protein
MTTIRSEIPATVWQVNVRVGDTVEPGDELIVLESMKMEIPVVAPAAGTVSAVHVASADRVQEGDALADVD